MIEKHHMKGFARKAWRRPKRKSEAHVELEARPPENDQLNEEPVKLAANEA